MQDQLYAVIDVETTGKGVLGNRITEICVVLLQGNKTLDKYTTFVNPEQPIPAFITELTGIDDSMVCNAPRFHEIAERIAQMTSGAIFVAHNVSFDYNVIRNEFKYIGQDFTRKKLCTVRLSRKLIPGLASYSLGKLCNSLNIPLIGRHRAEGDTDATVILLQRILSIDTEFSVISSFLKIGAEKQLNLPAHINSEVIEALPEQIGVYYFKDESGKIIYVGKGKNIKKSVMSHFYEKKDSKATLQQQVCSIDYETTGTELLASLKAIEKVQAFIPEFNTVLKKPAIPFQIIQYVNRKGVTQLAIDRLKITSHTLNIQYTRVAILAQLQQLCTKFQLCARFCNLETTTDACSNVDTKNCKGICQDQESVALYNIRVQEALNSIKAIHQTYIIKGMGRTDDEFSFVLVKEGLYIGYGYVPSTDQLFSIDDFEKYTDAQSHSYYTTKIIQNYIKKKGRDSLTYLNQYVNSEISY